MERLRPGCQPKQQGFSLVEIMIALTLGMILLAGVFSTFSAVVSSSAHILKVSQLNQQMRATMGIITQELRRIGYWADALNQDPTTNPNPFGFTIGASSGGADGCILYSYDSNANGVLDPTEQIGFRFRILGAKQDVQWSKGQSTAVTDCNANWGSELHVNLTNNKLIRVTQLSFKSPPAECTNLSTVPRSNCNPCDSTYQPWSVGDTLVKVPRIDITFSGELMSDPSVTTTLTNTVRVRNPVIEIATTAGPPAGTGC